jgi:hypothetical protein
MDHFNITDQMNASDRLNLSRMIDANNVKDCTQDIRDKKHSDKIRKDVQRLVGLKTKYEHLDAKQYDDMCVAQCNFLFNNYTEIFNKVKKDQMNLQILEQLLDVLRNIEEGTLNQHTGAFEVGKLMKAIYIDSALAAAAKHDAADPEKPKPIIKQDLSWKEYKRSKL